MSIRLSGINDQNILNAFRDIEQKLDALESRKSVEPGVREDVVNTLRGELENLQIQTKADSTNVFVQSGTMHSPGYVPTPGPTTPMTDRVLHANGEWISPLNGHLHLVPPGVAGSSVAQATAVMNGSLSVQSGLRAESISGRLLSIGKITGGLVLETTQVSGGISTIQPDAVSGLQGWWKADALTGLSDGNAVTTFSDQSGNSRDFTGSGSARPLYKTNQANGYPVLRFDGTDDVMATVAAFSTLITASAGTIFIVAKPTIVETSSTYTTLADVLLCDVNGIIGMHISGSSERYVANNFDGAHAYPTITSSLSAAFHSFLWRHSGGTVYGGLDDARDASLIGATSGNSTNLTGVARIGRNRDTGSIFTAVDIAEIIAYNVAVSESDRQGVEAYLGAKYGLSLGYSVNSYSSGDLLVVQDNAGNVAFKIDKDGKVYVRGSLVH